MIREPLRGGGRRERGTGSVNDHLDAAREALLTVAWGDNLNGPRQLPRKGFKFRPQTLEDFVGILDPLAQSGYLHQDLSRVLAERSARGVRSDAERGRFYAVILDSPSGSFGPKRGRPDPSELSHHRSFGIWIRPSRSCLDGASRRGARSAVPAATRSAGRHDGAVRPWKRRLSDAERSVLLSELLLRHPELVAEAEEITSTLLVVEDDQKLADEITARLRALRPSGPVSTDAGQARVLHALQPYIDDLTWRKGRGARRAADDIAIAILPGLHGCRDDSDEDMLLVRMGLPGAADDLAHAVYENVRSLHLSLPSLADECPEWAWYEKS